MAIRDNTDNDLLREQITGLTAQLANMEAMRLELEAMKASAAAPPWLETMLLRVTKASSAASELLASKLKPENADHLHRGPFEHPEGGIKYPKEYRRADGSVADFHRDEIVYAGRIMRAEECSYAEWLAVNALSESLGRGQRRVARENKWKATVDDHDRLTISVPMKTIDDRANLPPCLVIFQELTTGARQKDPLELATEVALLRDEIERMKRAAA